MRDLLRYVPGVTRVVRALERRERETRLFSEECRRLAAENFRLKTQLPRASGAPLAPNEEPPLPPEVLRLMVAGTDDAAWFRAAGKRGAGALAELLARAGVPLEANSRVLDFGCGCGRVIRHLRHLSAELHGCDTNPVAIDWCADHLPFARFAVNELGAPLEYGCESFDTVYAFSVFTHLPAPLQAHWMSELHRVLRPGGALVLSLHGDALLPKLARAERAAYRAGELVVRTGELPGTNHCAVFHPPAFVRGAFATGFEVLLHAPEGATGNPPQDAWVLRKRNGL
jgi:SAM-dependent methyltransferase